jgi:hypothetical protein
MALTRTVSDYKDSVKAATIGANINLAAAPNTLDGVSLVLSDRVLVKNQTPSSLNGIYRVTTLGTGSNGSWTRAADFNDYRQISSGALTFVEQGTTNGNIFYYIPGGEPNVQIGTTAITFANLFSSFGSSTSTATLQTVTNYGNSTTNIITISNTTPATNTTTGALVVSGGMGIGGNLYVGGNLSIAGNTTFINTQTITTTDTIAAPIISANVVGNVGSSHYGTIATNAQPFITSVGTLTGLISSANITAQTANVYAAYVVANSGIQGTLITNSQTNITSVGTLTSLTTSGNITAQTANIYAGNIISNTALITTSTTASNSTTTGALLVSGGAGVGANVYVGGNIYTQQRTGYTYSGNNTSVAYTYYNATTNSIDTVFG